MPVEKLVLEQYYHLREEIRDLRKRIDQGRST